MFFDALNEFGKDFDAIANFINSKLKRQKTDITCKSKEQIRALYYTTFHKITKFIKFSEGEFLLLLFGFYLLLFYFDSWKMQINRRLVLVWQVVYCLWYMVASTC